MNLWRNIKVQAALALFVAAAFTQLAHAGSRPTDRAVGPRTTAAESSTMPSQKALGALGARWNAIADSYGSRSTAAFSSAAHQRSFQQRLHGALGALDSPAAAPAATSGDIADDRLVEPGDGYTGSAVNLARLEEEYRPGVTDFPSPAPSSGPATTGYVVGGELIQPGTQPTTGLHQALRPDDRGGIRVVENRPIVVSADDGFDWNDAGIGALGALGACLLLVGCGLFAASHRRHKPAVL